VIWRACERLSIRPPGVADSFDDCDTWIKAMILGYEQLRLFEEAGGNDAQNQV
jgi:hypothetical protein